jgi:arylformamidase
MNLSIGICVPEMPDRKRQLKNRDQMSEWIDISVPLRTGMANWPGDLGVTIQQTQNINEGDVCNVRTISMSAHTGTHMDAPLHFIANGRSIDTMPIDATVGSARVIGIDDEQVIGPEELERHDLKPGERILFKTRNSGMSFQSYDEFSPEFVAISAGAARYLVEHRVRTVGVDYLSVGALEGDGVDTHRILLGAGLWVIEGLNLSRVSPGDYDLVCLPLKIQGGDGAPARAALRAR